MQSDVMLSLLHSTFPEQFAEHNNIQVWKMIEHKTSENMAQINTFSSQIDRNSGPLLRPV